MEKIVVVGFGWVGQANALALARLGFEVAYFDVATPPRHYAGRYGSLYEKIKPLGSLLEVDGIDTWYVVCIGDRVSEEGVQDITLIERALESLRDVQGKVILRSTVLPNHLAKLSFDLYLPEFLHELYAVEECLNPFYFVVGSREELVYPSFLKEWESRACKVLKGTPEEASHIKYLSNIWNALCIAFVNEFGDSIALPKTEMDRKKIERLMDFFFEKKSYLRYGQTFSGHCLPKDTRAFMAAKGEGAQETPILRAVYMSNQLHQKVVDTYHTLPQWFSAWDYAAYRRGFSSAFKQLWLRFNKVKVVQNARHWFKPIVFFFEKFISTGSLPELKKRWNGLAQENQYYYTNPDTKSGRKIDEFEIKETGVADYEKYIASDLTVKEYLGNTQDKVVLDIGVGVGRMAENLASDFKQVYGIDISLLMLETARKRLVGLNNIILSETEGNVIPYTDNQFDFIFSYLVFKHFPNLRLIEEYFREIKRTLRHGGLAKLQLRIGPAPHSWQWFYGVSLTPKAVKALAEGAGLTVIKIEEENEKSLWVWLKRC